MRLLLIQTPQKTSPHASHCSVLSLSPRIRHAEQHTEDRDQIDKTGRLTCRNSADPEIVAGIGAESDERAQVNNGQKWSRLQVAGDADTRHEQKRKEKDTAEKRLEGGQEKRRVMIGEMFQGNSVACGTDHCQEFAEIAE